MDCIGQKPLGALLAEKCEQFADRECIVFEDRDGRHMTISYRRFWAMVSQYAAILHDGGIRKSGRVMVVMMNCPEFIAVWFALARIGAVCMPVNVLAGAKELNVIADFTEAAAAITEPRYAALLAGVSQIPRVFVTRTASWYPNAEMFPTAVVLDGDDVPAAPPAEAGVSADDDALILFTAGADSELRAVVLTHANALFAGIFGAFAWQLTPQDRHLMVLPLFHINALFISVMPTLMAGATLIMTDQFNEDIFMRQVREYRATSASLVSANVKLLLDQPADPQDSANDLRHIMYAFAISEQERAAFEQRFNTRLCDLWGLTETLGATTLSPVFRKNKHNSIGIVRLGNEVKVVDDQGRELPPGQEGELIVRGVPGRTLMRCYFNDQELMSRKMRDGWFYTGDIGSMDADGYFYFSEKNYS
ncbi:MAG: AMP-binding protein [Deltaproteobacteria bacterium]|nr:AMP-binding protein [Deltaproteobacteria bacterium]